MTTINVFDFTEFPGLRHCDISDDSGELFYHKVLNEAFKNAFQEESKLIINLDNTAGYPPSFIDEAIGNLVYDFGLENVKKTVTFISIQEPDLIDSIEKDTYPNWEERRQQNDKPRTTQKHGSWFRYKDGQIIEVNLS